MDLAAIRRAAADRTMTRPAQLEALEGQEPAAMNSVMQGLIANANRAPELARVFSTYTASNPSIFLDIDREKAQALGRLLELALQ